MLKFKPIRWFPNTLAYTHTIVTNSADPDEMARYETSHLDIRCSKTLIPVN